MTNAKLAIAGAACLVAAFFTGVIGGRSLGLAILYITLLIAGIGLLVFALLRWMLAKGKVRGIAATFAAGGIMVMQYPLMALLPLPEILEGASAAVAIVGVLSIVVTAVWWLRTVIPGQGPPLSRDGS
jgi:hypothetical protein